MPTIRSPFIGPAYIEQTPNFADAQLINLYPEFQEGPGAKDTGVFYMTPGLGLLVPCGTGPVRGMAALNGTLYVVSGSGVYAVTPYPSGGIPGYLLDRNAARHARHVHRPGQHDIRDEPTGDLRRQQRRSGARRLSADGRGGRGRRHGLRGRRRDHAGGGRGIADRDRDRDRRCK